MAQTGYTTVQLYRTTTASATPTAGNLTDGELAINTTDEKLYFKNASGTVKLLAANVMPVANGGTGATTASVALTNLGAVAKAGDTMTGVLAFTAGTVSAPGITFSGDTNTGIFSPAADTIAFTEGGVESMRINSSGNVGIGTSSPGAKLAVQNDRAATALSQIWSVYNGASFENDVTLAYTGSVTNFGNFQSNPLAFLTNNTERMRITSSGNVGIGTSSPGAKLSIIPSQSGANVSIGDSLEGLAPGVTNGGAIYFGLGVTSASTPTGGIEASWGSAGTLPQIHFGLTRDGAKHRYSAFYDATLRMYTSDVERMRIDSSGNVGIGTSSPVSKLDVYAASGVQISASDGTVTQRVGYCGFGAAFSGTSSNHPYLLLTNDTERMRIDSSGNVGIGTASPASKLDVNGAIRDSKGDVRTIVQNAQTGAYVLVAADAGKHISITTGGVTVNTSIFSAGDAISIYNNSASNQTITQGASVTMYLGGTATTGNRTLAQRGICTILCVASNTFVISGAGLT
jgi:hypothetical protein